MSKILGSPAKLRKLQDEYAKKMAKFGLERGLDKRITHAIHKSSKRWKAENSQKEVRLKAYTKTFGTGDSWDIDTLLKFNENMKETDKETISIKKENNYEAVL